MNPRTHEPMRKSGDTSLIFHEDCTMLGPSERLSGYLLLRRLECRAVRREGSMTETKSASDKGLIDQELLAILCCPETKQEVSLAESSLITDLNSRVEKGELKNKAGQAVGEKLDGGLVRADKKILYPIRESIPVMLIEEGIPIEGLG